ncbi:ribonuclease H family protein [Aspergillus mulundensis]|uniref:ribonuclease H n=1 Tax=Aspergillus mulundensis TaxID=1810919 RepID=A0A3D8QRA2_9EURO|nr:Uncharacterized protein DSM5745_09736 [Aspergillus mulundensis]RDW64325.1 Uncharacterized protein DSM5745_09736 [Aspergillus mulundensis]
MPYVMRIYCDGGCRGNGRPGAIGAAAIVWKKQKQTWRHRSSVALPRSPPPTNQRAELTAIILALTKALEKYEALDSYPYVKVNIKTDSKYAIGCMNEWIHTWRKNGWRNSRGQEVVNRDLIQYAYDLDQRLKAKGTVTYQWVPREDNKVADQLANDNMDSQ